MTEAERIEGGQLGLLVGDPLGDAGPPDGQSRIARSAPRAVTKISVLPSASQCSAVG